MTNDERTLLLEVAKYCYATGMNKVISGAPLAQAIKRFEPDFELPSPLMDKPDRPWITKNYGTLMEIEPPPKGVVSYLKWASAIAIDLYSMQKDNFLLRRGRRMA